MAKKKILLLSDDLRMSSGVGTMSREFVMGTLKDFDWIQIAGAIKHPESGKFIDMNDAVRNETGIKDACLKIIPTDGYGNPGLIRHVIATEKPDAILHYTDPRFWEWLYQMEHEIRMQIPIFYYNIWDDLPYPMWNEPFYESCDLIMNISKQTHNIVTNVRKNVPTNDWNNTYVPHGINENNYYPIRWDHKEYKEMLEFRKGVLDNADKDFVVFWNNRNIRRKLPGDVILAYKLFCDMLPKEKADKCVLIMHTQPIDPNGTDLPKVVEAVCPEYDVVFSAVKLDDKKLNFLYNIGDVQLNMASNEGFGLTTCEALMAGTPVSVNVTGGLQDQCGFKYKGEFLTYKDYSWVHSLHDDKKWKDNEDLTWGDWVKPVWPSNRSLQGSVPTPYIFDDRPRAEDFADALKEWYDIGNDKRKECGDLGREFVMSDDAMMSASAMSKNFTDHMTTALEKWTKRKRFTIFNTSEAI
jgi:glycosyltransferase involved in cell wall biosynthesis